jgi:hypothetical protein
MQVIIESDVVNTRNGTSQRGRPYTIRTQAARLKGEWVAGAIELTLGDTQPPYSLGTYEIDFEKSISIAGFGQPQLSRNLVLLPAKAPLPFGKTGTNG